MKLKAMKIKLPLAASYVALLIQLGTAATSRRACSTIDIRRAQPSNFTRMVNIYT